MPVELIVPELKILPEYTLPVADTVPLDNTLPREILPFEFCDTNAFPAYVSVLAFPVN